MTKYQSPALSLAEVCGKASLPPHSSSGGCAQRAAVWGLPEGTDGTTLGAQWPGSCLGREWAVVCACVTTLRPVT